MKTKILLSILALGLIISAFGQKSSMELTFTAGNNGQYVPMDSILIENLTQVGDTTLYTPDTVLVLEYITGIGDNEAIDENTFSISQNYPNPFKGKTTVNLYLPEKENIKIICRNILGSELVHYENILNRGNNYFNFYSGNESYYLLTVTGKQTSRTIKMLNTGSHIANAEKCKIVYTGNNGNVNGFKSYEANNGFGFNFGDELKYIAYTDVEETEIIDSPTGSQIYTFQFNGWTPCPGISTVSDIDANVYNTVQIGSQCWMKENLKTTTYNNGTQIPNIIETDAWQNLTTGAYVWYNNDISWKDPYGALYNWYAAVDVNELCPTGWHVPTKDEWTTLFSYTTSEGKELRSCRMVNSPQGGSCNTIKHPRWHENSINGTDDYGFSGLPGGHRVYYDGAFYSVGFSAFWWTSTEHSSYDAWHLYLYFDFDSVTVTYGEKRNGFSVRCLRD